MPRSARGSMTSWPSALIGSLLAIGFAGCCTDSGIAPGDIPPCPQSVLAEALLADAECLSDEALAALVVHCEAIEILRE